MAARKLGTFLAIPLSDIRTIPDELNPWLLPLLESEPDPKMIPEGVRIVEVPWTDAWEKGVAEIKSASQSLLVSVKVPMSEGMDEQAFSLARAGVDIIHLEGEKESQYGPQQVKDGIRSVHLKLVDENLRDEVTLLASGGFAMAEHVAKAVICGADAVFADAQLLIALQCRMCLRCTKGLSCPVDIGNATSKWVAARVVNLFGAWHNQLLEVMGAMGIREARRMRGEAGRAMFYEELDEATFGSLGSVEEGCELE
jgi:hypothetical protein